MASSDPAALLGTCRPEEREHGPMNKLEARGVLHDQLQRWREQTWAPAREEVGHSHRFEMTAESGTWYQGRFKCFGMTHRMVPSESWHRLMTEVGAPSCR